MNTLKKHEYTEKSMNTQQFFGKKHEFQFQFFSYFVLFSFHFNTS